MLPAQGPDAGSELEPAELFLPLHPRSGLCSCLSNHFAARVMMFEMIPTNTTKPNIPKTNARARLEGEAIRPQELV